MAEELVFKDKAAAEYDRAFAHVTAHFMPFLLRAAHIAPGMHVLDIATGHLYFEWKTKFQTAFGPHAEAIMADIPKPAEPEPKRG